MGRNVRLRLFGERKVPSVNGHELLGAAGRTGSTPRAPWVASLLEE